MMRRAYYFGMRRGMPAGGTVALDLAGIIYTVQYRVLTVLQYNYCVNNYCASLWLSRFEARDKKGWIPLYVRVDMLHKNNTYERYRYGLGSKLAFSARVGRSFMETIRAALPVVGIVVNLEDNFNHTTSYGSVTLLPL
jgi:hypothetical protein